MALCRVNNKTARFGPGHLLTAFRVSLITETISRDLLHPRRAPARPPKKLPSFMHIADITLIDPRLMTILVVNSLNINTRRRWWRLRTAEGGAEGEAEGEAQRSVPTPK